MSSGSEHSILSQYQRISRTKASLLIAHHQSRSKTATLILLRWKKAVSWLVELVSSAPKKRGTLRSSEKSSVRNVNAQLLWKVTTTTTTTMEM